MSSYNFTTHTISSPECKGINTPYCKWLRKENARINATIAKVGGYQRAGKGGYSTDIHGYTTPVIPGKVYSTAEIAPPREYHLSPLEAFETAFTAIAPVIPVVGPILAAVNTIATTAYQSVKEDKVNIGGLLSGIGGAIGGISNPIAQFVGNAVGAAGGIVNAIAPPKTTTSFVPYSPMPTSPASTMPQAQPVMSAAPIIAAGAGMVSRITRPILTKIAAKLGKMNVSLPSVIGQIRKMAKFSMGPEAIAFSLGITSAELATLITAHTSKRTRRMNPANGKALRRAIRRVKSFHRLCVHTDVIKRRHRK